MAFQYFIPVDIKGIAPEKWSGSRVIARLEDSMLKRVLVCLAMLVTNVIIGGTLVANATELGTTEASKLELGDMFQFNQNVTLTSKDDIKLYVDVTPYDICYMISEDRIYVDGMEPSVKIYTRMDTEVTVIKKEACIIGDLNEDTNVDSFDLVMARKILIESIKGNNVSNLSVIRADINMDGKFNVADLVALNRFLLGCKEVVNEEECDYIAVKSISPHGFAGSSGYVVSLFNNGDLTINSKLYAVNVIDIGLDADCQSIVMQGGKILGESQKSWIKQSDEDPLVSGETNGITVKPTGFSGASQHFVCVNASKQLYIDGNFYADGVEQVYVEDDKASQNFGAVICRGGEWYNTSPGWVIKDN